MDPNLSLPSELFYKSLSYLSPSSIATASVISRKWRNKIHSYPTLHQEVDLTSLNQTDETTKVNFHLERLSSLARNRLVDVSLDLSGFWMNHRDDEESPWSELEMKTLLSTLRKSRLSLRRISLLINDQSQDGLSNSIQFFLVVLREIIHYEGLKEIYMEGPLWITLKAQNVNDFKRFHISNNSLQRDDSYLEQPGILSLMKMVGGFMNGDFITEFVLKRTERSMDDEAGGILKELKKSRLTLRTLDLINFDASPRKLWNLAISCPRLNNLALSLSTESTEDQEGTNDPSQLLEIPTGLALRDEGLSKLHLELENFKVDWEALSPWAGDRLEELVIFLEGQSQEILHPNFSNSIFFGSRKTLKVLEISGILCQEEDLPSSTSSEIYQSFPNLTNLSLFYLGSALLQWFSKIKSSNLKNLTIISDRRNPQRNFDCLMELLNNYHDDLEKVFFQHVNDRIRINLPSDDVVKFLSFENLKELDFGYCGDLDCLEWFSKRFHYPNLTRLDSTFKDLKVKFKNKAPKLIFD